MASNLKDFTSIHGYIVEYTGSETDVILPDVFNYIGESAFCDYVDLKSITFSNTVEYIGDNAFSGCTSLETVKLSD